MYEQSRRTFLRTAGASATLGLAGCASLGGSGGLDALHVAYMPIYPDMQHFVMTEEGFLADLPVPVKATRFSDGPSIVQAYAKGDFEVALFGVVPAMIVVDKTGSSKVTAANIRDAMQVLATESFADRFAEAGADAFAAFEEEHGRPFTFGTFPPGSVPDILLRYWLERELGLDPGSDVTIKPLAGAGPVRQALLSGEIDGTSIMEPVPTIADRRGAPYESIAWAGDFMPGQPAAVTLMHDRLREDHPDVARAYLEQHVRATAFVNANPDRAAADASAVIGEDVLPVETAQAAMDSPASDFVSDPHVIADGAATFADYAHRLGKTDQALSLDQLFDFDVYDGVTG